MTREEVIKLLTTPLSEYNYIEVKDFARLEREGKLQKDKLYIVHGSVEDMEKIRRQDITREKEEAIRYIRSIIPYVGQNIKKSLEMAIKVLEQESKIDMLDKIRAEIEELKPNNPNFKGYFEQNVALNNALDIIDKYMAKSEDDIWIKQNYYVH